MKYVLLIVGAIIAYYLLGWIACDILETSLYSDNDTIETLLGRKFLGYAIASTVWGLVMAIILCNPKYDSNITERDATTALCAFGAPWAFYAFCDKLPATDGTAVLAWLITLGGMVVVSVIAAKAWR